MSAKSPVALAIFAVVGGAAFVLALWLGAYGPEISSGLRAAPTPLSNSFIGYSGLVQLLKLEGAAPRVSRTSPDLAFRGLGVLTPENKTELASVKDSLRSGVHLVILPKWTVVADPRHGGWAMRGEAEDANALAVLKQIGFDGGLSSAKGAGYSTLRWPDQNANVEGLRTPIIRESRRFTGGTAETLLRDHEGFPILIRLPGSRIYVLSEPDLLNNAGVGQIEGAMIASSIMDRLAPDAPIIFDVSINRAVGAQNSLKLLFQPPLSSAFLCLLLVAVLAGAQSWIRFGRPKTERPIFAPGKRALVESTVSLLSVARRETKLAPRYLEAVTSVAAVAIGLSGDLDSEARIRELDRLSRKRSLAVPSEMAAAAGRLGSRVELMQWAETVYQWREEITREAG